MLVSASLDIKACSVAKKTDVTLILACMMACVWRSTTNWVFYAIAQRDIVAHTVKIWIPAVLIHV